MFVRYRTLAARALAPALFAEEDEATRIARVSKADLVGALKRLRRAKPYPRRA
jgi:hypothetical protein